MSARRESPDADPIGIEIVLGGIGPKPSDRSFAIFDLRWKRGDGSETIIDASHGVSILHHSNCWTPLFSAAVPASSMDPNDHRQRTRDLLRKIKIEGENCAIDALINYISLNRTTGNLRRQTPRHTRLRDLPAQHSRSDCESQPCIPPSHQANHPIF